MHNDKTIDAKGEKMHAGIEVGDTVYTSYGGYWWTHGKPELREYVVTKKGPSGRLAVASQSGGNYTTTLYFKTREEAFAYWRSLVDEKIERVKAELHKLETFRGQTHD